VVSCLKLQANRANEDLGEEGYFRPLRQGRGMGGGYQTLQMISGCERSECDWCDGLSEQNVEHEIDDPVKGMGVVDLLAPVEPLPEGP
jgi:hypothetical protein